MERLKRYLVENEMSQAAFAKKVGKSQPTVSDWLSGQIQPSTDSLREISQATGLSIDELLDNVAA